MGSSARVLGPVFCQSEARGGLCGRNRCVVGWLRILLATFPAQRTLFTAGPGSTDASIPLFLSVAWHSVQESAHSSVIHSTMLLYTRPPHAASSEPAGWQRATQLFQARAGEESGLRVPPPGRSWHFNQFTYRLLLQRRPYAAFAKGAEGGRNGASAASKTIRTVLLSGFA